MLTAVFNYRDYVPYGWFAFKFASLKFYGENKVPEKLNKIADMIKFQNFSENNLKAEFLEELKKENNLKIKEIENKVQNIKKKYKMLFLHKNAKIEIEKLQNEWLSLMNTSKKLDEKIKEYNDARFISTYKCIDLYRKLLASFGFICTASNKDRSHETVEHYESTMPIYKVLDLISEKTIKLTKIKEEKIEEAKNKIELCKTNGDLSALDNTYISLNK